MRSESRDAERVENGGDEKRRRVAGEIEAEVSEQQRQQQEAFAESDHHEGQDLAEQKFMRRNAGDIDLQDGFLLAFFRHGERGQQRRKQRERQHEDSWPVKFLRGAPGVVPEPNRGLNRLRARGAGVTLRSMRAVISAGVARNEFRGIGVGSVDQHLYGRR